ncbi:MAG TPA: hypothetical protein V6C71_05015 [Coleofasciculaceae cyanobacterium]
MNPKELKSTVYVFMYSKELQERSNSFSPPGQLVGIVETVW